MTTATDFAALEAEASALWAQAREARDKAMTLTARIIALAIRDAYPRAAVLELTDDDESEGQYYLRDLLDSDGLIIALPEEVQEVPIGVGPAAVGWLIRDLEDDGAWQVHAPEILESGDLPGGGRWVGYKRQLQLASVLAEETP